MKLGHTRTSLKEFAPTHQLMLSLSSSNEGLLLAPLYSLESSFFSVKLTFFISCFYSDLSISCQDAAFAYRNSLPTHHFVTDVSVLPPVGKRGFGVLDNCSY